MRDAMPKDLSEFEKYLIKRLDRIEEKISDLRVKVASMAVIISIVTAVITTLVTSTVDRNINKHIDKTTTSM